MVIINFELTGGMPSGEPVILETAAKKYAALKNFEYAGLIDEGRQAKIYRVKSGGEEYALRLESLRERISINSGIPRMPGSGRTPVDMDAYGLVRDSVIKRDFYLADRLAKDESFRNCRSIVNVREIGCIDLKYMDENGIGDIVSIVFTLMDLYVPIRMDRASVIADPEFRSEKHVLRIGVDICDALELLHTAGSLTARGKTEKEGIAHSDIKTQNVMYDPKSGHYVLVDLGTLRPRSGKKTMTRFIASYGYLDPAAVVDGDPNHLQRTLENDLYSLTAVLYTLVNTVEGCTEEECLPEPDRFNSYCELVYKGEIYPPRTDIKGRKTLSDDIRGFLVNQLSYRMKRRRCHTAYDYKVALQRLQLDHGYFDDLAAEVVEDKALAADIQKALKARADVEARLKEQAAEVEKHSKDQAVGSKDITERPAYHTAGTGDEHSGTGNDDKKRDGRDISHSWEGLINVPERRSERLKYKALPVPADILLTLVACVAAFLSAAFAAYIPEHGVLGGGILTYLFSAAVLFAGWFLVEGLCSKTKGFPLPVQLFYIGAETVIWNEYVVRLLKLIWSIKDGLGFNGGSTGSALESGLIMILGGAMLLITALIMIAIPIVIVWLAFPAELTDMHGPFPKKLAYPMPVIAVVCAIIMYFNGYDNYSTLILIGCSIAVMIVTVLTVRKIEAKDEKIMRDQMIKDEEKRKRDREFKEHLEAIMREAREK